MKDFKDHEVREFVNVLTDTARRYKDAGSLREAIARVVKSTIGYQQQEQEDSTLKTYVTCLPGNKLVVTKAKSVDNAKDILRIKYDDLLIWGSDPEPVEVDKAGIATIKLIS